MALKRGICFKGRELVTDIWKQWSGKCVALKEFKHEEDDGVFVRYDGLGI
jgi:hypothetical protein